MGHRVFLLFIFPSLLAMCLFIALPIVSVVIQSLHVEHEQVLVSVETCDPFGCKESMKVDVEATEALLEERPLGRYNGLSTYTDRNHLAFAEVERAWEEGEGVFDFANRLLNLPFYKALFFTLSYTFVVTPLVIILGFVVALCVNRVHSLLKGFVIFVSLLPMIVTPLIGSLILFWMIDAEGIIGATLQLLFDDPDLSLKSSPVLTWLTLFVYGVWHSSPFAFVVLYAGLQTLPHDTMESAMIDGANRWQRIWYVVVPHLMPLVTFISLMQLMDNFRVFEPIVGFHAEASATSLSWIIYNDLQGEVRLFGSAGATSVMTIIGVMILLSPVIMRTWKEERRKVR